MDFQEERQLAKAFFIEVCSPQLAHVPKEIWDFTNPKEHVWHFEVNQVNMEQYPYRFSLHFDHRNRVLTFSLLHQHTKSIRVFPHLYYRLIAFLEEQRIDCIVRNEDDCLKGSLYNKKDALFHSTGPLSRQVGQLMQQILGYVDQSMIYWWKEGQSVHLATPHVSPLFWTVNYIYDESKRVGQGRLEVNGMAVRNIHDIHRVFDRTTKEINQIPCIEQTIIAYIAELDAKSYYDPQSRSLVIFGKKVPFKVYLKADGDAKFPFSYIAKFGEFEIIADDVKTLNDQLRGICKKYVNTVRLKAAVEGRA